MEIQKVFSDYYDTERFYSVIMNERELRLFAAAKEVEEDGESGLSKRDKIALGIAALGGTSAAAAYGADKFADKMIKKDKALGFINTEKIKAALGNKKAKRRIALEKALKSPADAARKLAKVAKKHKVLAGLGAAGTLGGAAYGYHALGEDED